MSEESTSTDKKYAELLKCAAAYVEAWDHMMSSSREFIALKACLPPPPPSREEIADYLETHVEYAPGKKAEAQIYMDLAIEELRKEQ